MIAINARTNIEEGVEKGGGILEIMPEGIGFLRENYQMSKNDIYVSQAQLRRFDLRNGDMVFGQIRPPRESERHYGLIKVESVNGMVPEENHERVKFENLTPIFPEQRIDLETKRNILSNRLINLIAPIGRGQRGMIVSPPKAGKTTIMKEIANAVSENYPEIDLLVSLIGERPEEVTDMDRSVEGEVVASTFDEPVTSHVRTAEITLNRAKRPGGDRTRRGHPDGQPHAPGARLQPGSQSLRPYPFRRYGPPLRSILPSVFTALPATSKAAVP